jgi:hypothetical protein
MRFEDRRIFERFQLELPLSYSLPASQEKFYLHSHDISAQGLGVISDSELPCGAELNMSIRIPTLKKELPAQGKVTWSKRSGASFRAGLVLKKSKLMEISAILRVPHCL